MKYQSLGALGRGEGAQVCDCSGTYTTLTAGPGMSEEYEGSDCNKQLSW